MEGGRKEETRLGIHVFESPDSIVWKTESMFVMFIKGKPQNRKKETASRAAFLEEEGGSPFSKSVVLPSGTIGQWGGAFDRSPNDLPNSDGMQGWSPHYAVCFPRAHANTNLLLSSVGY